MIVPDRYDLDMFAGLAQSGGGFSQYQGLIRVAIFAIFIAFTGISWVFKKLNQQAQIRRAKEARERQQAEALRTGRAASVGPSAAPGSSTPAFGGTSPESDAKRRLQELALRRRAELERLARQQAGAGTPASVPPPVPTPRPAAAPPRPNTSPDQVRRAAAPPVTMSPPSLPRPGPAPQQQRRQPDPQKRRPQPARPPIQPPAFSQRTPTPTRRVVSDAPSTGEQAEEQALGASHALEAAPIMGVEGLRTGLTADLRKAFVLAEILGRPVAMRDRQSDGG